MAIAASSFVPTAGFAALSGLVISCFVNLVAYGAYKRDQAKYTNRASVWNWQKTLLALFIIGNLIGVGCFLYAESFGAVAVAMPSETAVLLLSNLMFQHFLGIKTIDSTCLKGTLVLCAATGCLKDVGPIEADTDSMDVFSRILTPTAMGWLFLQLVLGGACFCLICRADAKANRRSNVQMPKMSSLPEPLNPSSFAALPKDTKQSESNFQLTLAYAALVAVATAAGAAVGKMLTQAHGIILYECYFAYAAFGFLSFYYGAKAAEECDQSKYLPINECIKLALTAVTGLIVWGDQVDYPLTYFMVYVLLCLGASFCAESEVHEEAFQPMSKMRSSKSSMSSLSAKALLPLSER